MKLNLNKLFIGLVVVAALALAPIANAQNIGLYAPIGGGTIVMPQFSTNTFLIYQLTNGVQTGVFTTNSTYAAVPTGGYTNLTVNVAGFDNIGFTGQWTENTYNTNLAVGVSLYRSYNFGATFETTPYFIFTNILLAANAPYTYTICTNMYVPGVTTLGLAVYNNSITNATFTGYVTNVTLNFNLKGITIQTVPAGINSGVLPGQPITVPGWFTNAGH